MRVIIFILLLLSDQLTKWVALERLELGQPVEIIPGFFNMTLVFNPGIAFGLLSGLPEGTRQLVLVCVSVFAMCVVIGLAQTEARHDNPSRLAIVMILGGAIGNFIDRLRLHYVVDFFDFHLAGYHWPAFNIADSAICLGVTVLLYRMTFCVQPPPQSPVINKNSPPAE